MKYYLCSVCGNLFEVINDSNNTPVCCGRNMKLLYPESTDGALEKHVPFIIRNHHGDGESSRCLVIQVGEVPHPMEKLHFIQWIEVQTDRGIYRKHLEPEDKPKAKFFLHPEEKIRHVYAYCNLHGLYENK